MDNDERPKKPSAAGPRVNVACERCRKRHIRCDGQEICSNCHKMKAECVYIEGDKKIVVSLKYLKALREENDRLKSLLQGISSEFSERPNKRQRLSPDPLSRPSGC